MELDIPFHRVSGLQNLQCWSADSFFFCLSAQFLPSGVSLAERCGGIFVFQSTQWNVTHYCKLQVPKPWKSRQSPKMSNQTKSSALQVAHTQVVLHCHPATWKEKTVYRDYTWPAVIQLKPFLNSFCALPSVSNSCKNWLLSYAAAPSIMSIYSQVDLYKKSHLHTN